MDPYRSTWWKKFRDEVIRLDGGRCVKCGRSPEDGTQLHVHHKEYLPGRKPWEYEHHYCETLCSGCHAAEHGVIKPKTGWQHVGYEDLGDLIGSCEYCGTSIRHVFVVHHEKWMTMEVGEICCDKLTATTTATAYMAAERSLADKRKRFISSPRWKLNSLSHANIKQGTNRIFVIPSSAGYLLRINGKDGKKRFASELEAKIAAFDLTESGDIDKYFAKCEADAREHRTHR